MTDFYDVRCQTQAHYRPGKCDLLLFRVSSTGGIEIKCKWCKTLHMYHRTQLDTYHEYEHVE